MLNPYFPEPDIGALVESLSGHVSAAAKGDLSRPEAMLVSQAQTLGLLFNKLTRQAVQNIGHYPDTVSLYLKLALRAQSQCRAAAETLFEMKNPRPVAFFQQANIANWPQQVNNGSTASAEGLRAGEIEKERNELLEDTEYGEQLDGSAPQSAAGRDIQMATVDKGDRATVQGR